MSLTYCGSCRSVEGKTRELTDAERAELGIAPDEVAGEVCAECDSLEELTCVPEHDDYDMER